MAEAAVAAVAAAGKVMARMTEAIEELCDRFEEARQHLHTQGFDSSEAAQAYGAAAQALREHPEACPECLRPLPCVHFFREAPPPLSWVSAQARFFGEEVRPRDEYLYPYVRLTVEEDAHRTLVPVNQYGCGWIRFKEDDGGHSATVRPRYCIPTPGMLVQTLEDPAYFPDRLFERQGVVLAQLPDGDLYVRLFAVDRYNWNEHRTLDYDEVNIRLHPAEVFPLGSAERLASTYNPDPWTRP